MATSPAPNAYRAIFDPNTGRVQIIAVGRQGDEGKVGLKGERGPRGATGRSGSSGGAGSQGPTGLTGAQGDTGAQGIQGIQGPIGQSGLMGPPGPDVVLKTYQAPVESPNGSRVQFTLAESYVAGTLTTFLNGIVEPITEVNTTTFNFSQAPVTADTIYLSYRKV